MENPTYFGFRSEDPSSLDFLDKKILSWLMQNCRLTDTQIAKSVKVSKSTVGRRIKSLEDRGIITGYITYTNPLMIESKLEMVFIRLDSSTKESDEFCKRITGMQGCFSISLLAGEWDVLVGFTYQDNDSKEGFVSNVLNDKHVTDYEIMGVEKITFTPLIIPEEDKICEVSNSARPPHRSIDVTDREILEIVSQNARLKLQDISSRTGLAWPTVKRKLTRMVQEGIIAKFQAQCDYFKLGMHPYVVCLKLKDIRKLRVLKVFLYDSLRCNDVLETVGAYNAVAVMHFSNLKEIRIFEEEMNNLLGSDRLRYRLLPITRQYNLRWQ